MDRSRCSYGKEAGLVRGLFCDRETQNCAHVAGIVLIEFARWVRPAEWHHYDRIS
jgi:hypothetical protein